MIITEAILREPLRRRLRARAPKRLGFGKPSAVLLPLFEADGEVRVWLVRRPSFMRDHGGQVAFPGGKLDLADGTLEHTALRETHEELGIEPTEVDLLGGLDEQITITQFAIAPFVGWIGPSTPIAPNPAEVARAFSAPLSLFLEKPRGIRRSYETGGEHIWGATSLIAHGLGRHVAEILRETT
jgi:8-oxo-dGTP pyrophosphatase MutT (NUDIX family)